MHQLQQFFRVVLMAAILLSAESARAEQQLDSNKIHTAPGPVDIRSKSSQQAEMPAQSFGGNKDRQRARITDKKLSPWPEVQAPSLSAEINNDFGAGAEFRNPSDPLWLGGSLSQNGLLLPNGSYLNLSGDNLFQSKPLYGPDDCTGDECTDYAPFPKIKRSSRSSPNSLMRTKVPYFGLTVTTPFQW